MLEKNLIGKRFHVNDLILYPKQSEIRKGDFVLVGDHYFPKSGHIVIADQNFKDSIGNHGFNFQKNPNHEGYKNTGMSGFCRKIEHVKNANPLIYTFTYAIKFIEANVIVKAENGIEYIIQYPEQNYGGRIGNVIHAYINNNHCDFAAYGGHYPLNAMRYYQ